MDEADLARRRELVRRCADGEMRIHELRDAYDLSMIELFADLAELGRRPPLADMVGPNVDTRRAGIDRLAALLRQ